MSRRPKEKTMSEHKADGGADVVDGEHWKAYGFNYRMPKDQAHFSEVSDSERRIK